MGKMTISKDPSRQVFVHQSNDCWLCRDYKTFYITIRPTNLEMDKQQGRDPNHYVLCFSNGNIIDGINGLPKAFTTGYEYVDNVTKSWFK